MKSTPILYSFRRCPYAMRARLAIAAQNIEVELREVVLRDKPAEMIAASPKATVPVLILTDGSILDESLNIMRWATQNETSSNTNIISPTAEMFDLIAEIDGPFKHNLDRYKYANRYEDAEALSHRDACFVTLKKLDEKLAANEYLFGPGLSFADIAIAPFIRQFANTDKNWFFSTPFMNLQAWLTAFCESPFYQSIMDKYPKWSKSDEITIFPSKK